MPPVTKAGGTDFRKDVEFVAKDEDEQVAAGIVMVPDKADLQNDFAREETIREFAEQFAAFKEAGQASGGIMHAVFPDGWMRLERNEVLDEAEEIGGRTVDAGTWVQEWTIENADLWGLIDEGILSGYSIGAIQVDWNGPHEQDADAVDEVDTSEIPDGELVWELTDGIVREVSAVDIPAVPDAQILEAKADADKRLAEHIGNQDAFIEEALERGHSQTEAERLWGVLNDAMEVDGSTDPGKHSMFHRAGKAFLSALSGTDDGTTDDATPEDPDRAAKEGRTLSKANERRQMAVIDAALDTLQDAGVDHGMTRFTDQDDVDFDLSEHSAREWADDHDDNGDDGGADLFDVDSHAPEGDTSDADDTTDMTDDSPENPWDDAPEWAKDLRDDVQENSQQIDDVLEEGADKDASADDAGGDGDDPWSDAPEWAKALKDDVDENAERIDTISKQSGYSDQLRTAPGGDETDDDPLDNLGKALS